MDTGTLDLNMTILVVEDSDFMMKIFVRLLEELGFSHILQAEHGKAAIQQIKSNRIDLIISDWNMPVMDGLNFLKYIRLNQQTEHIPFLMATAQGDMTKQSEARDAGADGHLAKPLNRQQLQEKIAEVLGLKIAVASGSKKQRAIKGKITFNLAHIQITDHLLLGVLRHQIETGEVTPKFFNLNTHCMPGWNPIEKALKEGSIDGAFVLAPIAMDLFAFDIPIKLVLLAHRNGSIMVRSVNHQPREGIRYVYLNHTVSIPHKMSVHNMLAHQFLSELGLKPGVPGQEKVNVFFEVIPPIQMPRMMQENREVAGFIVAEPIGSNAISRGIGEKQFLSASVWQEHPCCVVAFRQEMITRYPDAVYEFCALLVKAGRFVENYQHQAAEIAVPFLDPRGSLGLNTEILGSVLNESQGIRFNNLYPELEDLDQMQRYMHDKMEIGRIINLEKFVDIRFGDVVC